MATNGTNAADILEGDDKNDTINGLGGNDTLKGKRGNDLLNGNSGNDTVDYAQANNGIVANLVRGVVVSPIYGKASHLKVMPLGDSITAGRNRVNPIPGAYRNQLWADFSADNLSLNFVGSQSNGPNSLGDRDHEGHPGWRIFRINDLFVTGALDSYQPDVVLLGTGTNDTRTKSLDRMSEDLGNLIDTITEHYPNTQLLVSSIPPIDASINGNTRSNNADNFNNLLPDIVGNAQKQGKKVDFVDVGGSLSVNDLVSDGIHPTAEGYKKMGDAWYNALVERDTLTGIENVTGTAYKDTLIGDTGANVLRGGGGKDILTGGGGKDTFVYKTANEGADRITDFGGNDRFKFSARGFGGGLVVGTELSTQASATGVFVSGENPTPLGTNANFLYSTDTGILSFDVDGTGSHSALDIAKITGTPSLSSSQIFIT